MSETPKHPMNARRRVDSRGRTYWITIEWASGQGALVPTELRVRCNHGVDATLVREIKVATEIDEARKAQVDLMSASREWLPEEARKRAEEILESWRRPEDDLDLLGVIAVTYRAAGRAPARAVYEELQRRGVEVSRSQAGKLIMRCREVGLLGPAEPRRAGERVEVEEEER